LQGDFIKVYANDQTKISCGEFLVTVNCDYVIADGESWHRHSSGYLILQYMSA